MIPEIDYYDVDSDSLPTCIQSDGFKDGADAAADVGNLLACCEYVWVKKLHLFLWDGVPVRCAHRTTWDGQKDRFSRDQLIAMLCGFMEATRGYAKEQAAPVVKAFLIAHLKHLFLFAWNTKANGGMDRTKNPPIPDICGPAVWALWLRIYKVPLRRIVLWALDIENALNLFRWKYDDTRITRNYILIALKCYQYDPTWVSRLVFKYTPWDDLIDRWRDNCRITHAYQTAPVMRRLLSKLKEEGPSKR